MSNYFSSLNFREKLIQLKQCKLMHKKDFSERFEFLKNKKIVIVGCGAQGLNQGLNMRDSGLNVSYALRINSILNKNSSWNNAVSNKFLVGTYDDLVPTADLVINLTPDKQHKEVVNILHNLMKKNAILGFSHGFNIVEVGQKIRQDITVIMVAPKCPGTEVREEYKRGFGVPTLISVHLENDPQSIGLKVAKEWATAIGGHRAGVLYSSFSAEVKSDLMGEQTILCGLLQTGSILCYDKLISQGYDRNYSGRLIQLGWEVITEALKHGGITLMFDRLSNTAKIRAYMLSNMLKKVLLPLFRKHMDDIISGSFSENMMLDWKNNDHQLITWRKNIQNTNFEKCNIDGVTIMENEYFENGLFMVSMIKAGVELAFEVMAETGITEESAYYESLHELPLIANTIARKRLYEMNLVISDTAEYGSYLFFESSMLLLKDFMNNTLKYGDLGNKIPDDVVDNVQLNFVNTMIRNHPIEIIGKRLRCYMVDMKKINIST